jgi:adenosine deaminase
VAQLFCFRDFQEFLTVYMALVRSIIRGEDFEQLAYELGLSLAQQHVRYAEVMVSPMQHMLRGVDMYEAIEGTAAGFARARRETGILVRLGFDFGRQYGPDPAWPALEAALRARSLGVVFWSIGGNEVGHPPEPFVDVFKAARAGGLHLAAHAGEVVGPASVWGAVDVLGVERLGHGIRSVDDERLLHHLRAQGVVLDVCPTSNLLTGATAAWEEHPLRYLFDSGITVTINSDDPTFFSTTLTEEYRRIVQRFGFTTDELCQLVRNSVNAAFLPADERALLAQQIDGELVALRQELGV